jgi:hypothetical protein
MKIRAIQISGFLALSALALVITPTVSAQQGGSNSQDITVTGRNGKTATYQNNASWGNGVYTDNRQVTGFNGRTAQSSTTASWAPGSTSRQTRVTGFNGKTSTYTDNRSWGNGVYTNTKSYTGVNGRTGTDTVTRSGGMVTNTLTGPKGNSRTYTHRAHYHR